MVNRVIITLEQPEYSALLKMALSELRNPQDQIRWLLRRELESRKLLKPAPSPKATEATHEPSRH